MLGLCDGVLTWAWAWGCACAWEGACAAWWSLLALLDVDVVDDAPAAFQSCEFAWERLLVGLVAFDACGFVRSSPAT